jgi:hypothetical protein
MRRKASLSLEAWVLIYFLIYLPNVMVTRLLTTAPHEGLGRPLTGLETLPASLVINMLLTFLFIWVAKWTRDAHAVNFAGARIPVPTRYTFVSGIGTALVLFTVPLSFTIRDVSIPFMQLLMRGDILLIAPLLDLMFGRKVRWWSWTALVLVLVALMITLRARGGFHLPPLALLTVVLYTFGYFLRLYVMNRISKGGGVASMRQYFVEEKIVALPLSILALSAISATGVGGQSGELYWGFVSVWTDPAMVPILVIGAAQAALGVAAIVILLDPKENAYCIPLERASSLVAGVFGSVLLAWFWTTQMPSAAELIGAAILIGSIVLLSVAPRLGRRTAPGALGREMGQEERERKG